MTRLLRAAIASAPLLAGPALRAAAAPAPGPQPPALSVLQSSPAYVGDLLSLRGQAPRRTRMSLSPGSAINPKPYTPYYTSLTTFMQIAPLSAVPYAMRIAFANPFSGNMQVVSASIWPTDSYGGPLANQAAWNSGTATRVNGFPTANSVFAICTTVSGSTAVTCPSTAGFPTAATMYVLGANVAPYLVTGTVANSTTVTLSAAATASGSVQLQFANIASGECKLYFDNAGADSDQINTAGVKRSLSLPGSPSAPASAPTAYTLQWSDFAPCTTVARADGGAQPLVAIYVTVGSNATTFTSSSVAGASYNAQVAPLVGNRFFFAGMSWNGDVDETDTPQYGWRRWTTNPVLEIQYLTAARGWNVLSVGDSITTSPPDDQFSGPVWRACMMLSTPQAPCEVTNLGWGGQNSSVYDEALRNNIDALRPSAVVAQPISRNDGVTLSAYQQLLAKAQSYTAKSDARLGLLGAFPFTYNLDGSLSSQAGVATMRGVLNDVSTTCQPGTGGQTCPRVPVLDPVPIITRAALGGNFWSYLGLLDTANGATAAGATTIPVTTNSGQIGCYPGDVLTDTTNPGAVAPGATVTAATPTALTVPATAVVGGGIASGDALVCSAPGWTGGSLSNDNTHPWYPAILLLQPAANAFLQQLLGLQ